MSNYPFLSLPAALVVLRVSVAGLFMAHAAARIALETVPRFGSFLEGLGFPFPVAWVWAITGYEIVAGTLMALGWRARWMAGGLFVIAAVGIVLIHRHFGWFVGEHGTGGSEYSVALMVALLVIAAADAPAASFPSK
jgi:putative oxidoreductase